ncbi:MAG TPA: PQQ-binding-like beta-propeller repeat protein [Candidatus Cloacimonadota bacterium]|nr:PQQ-binding-like beta-propeller repeat protein [Candidatus Cloacimonadota bacterium]
MQFGRIFAVLADAKSVTAVGKNWKHAHVSTAEDLELLGYSEKDIRVKTQRILINDEQSLIVAPGVIAGKLFAQLTDKNSLDALLGSFASATNAMWLVLSGKPELQPKKRKKLTRLQISSIILLLITLLAVLYISFGNRFLDTGARKLKMLFRSRTSQLEQLPRTLNISNAEVIKLMDKVVNSPARNIVCSVAWNTDLPYSVTANPAFDLDHIYLAAGKTLLAYDKKTRNLLWNVNLESDIISLRMTQASLVAGLANRNVIGIRNDGSPAWTAVTNRESGAADKPATAELTNSNDARIDGSILVIPEERGLSVLDSSRGEKLSGLTLIDELKYLSAYDSFANCFYAIAGESLICLELKILN